MLSHVAEGVLVHQSEFMQSNAVVVDGTDGVLVIDPGLRDDELACLANDLAESGRRVVMGFSTHPHWDHLLWHPELGSPQRYGTAAGAAMIQARMSTPGWEAAVTGMMPQDLVDHVPLDGFGLIDGLPAGAVEIPWDGPRIRIIEHRAHAPGHAALVVEESRVLVAGDMLSDILIPMLNPRSPDPIDDYLAALRLFDGAADDVETVIPGHGSVGDADQLRARIEKDRTYVAALRDRAATDDSRLGPSAPYGEEMTGVHEWQVQQQL
ncbi:MAG: MBL fold metallo-hydrolase [Humibacter sp.]